ncbi:biotin-dependent carboxyltransferase family protein [Rosenbergiella australiborealis]|uniref:Biotin-dependent carboxyltransferase family protein n=1 Tax=Rosenbergiella australiborealis TaxID=1544696 RepID=A0ABS5T3X7_9GAMM|nr:biotin-dependent carboxyltransferase family protein [Rosenbergiella australiborealis]MBT0727058.1 biotin-dependent carboxyltransferase family protein [Rosenbergiella australiborealis]
MLTVIKAGLATSLQDQGRFGLAQFGVGRCGALDLPAMQTANLLVANPRESAVIEITQGNAVFQFERDCWFALTGAECQSTLSGQAVVTGWRYHARAGECLRLHSPIRGMRSYLAVSGGFNLPTVMGSQSTDLNAGFGGFQGRFLQNGDVLTFNDPSRTFKRSVGVRQILWGNRVRVIPGPEFKQFSRDSQLAFWRTGWTVTTQSNRMGHRLQGRVLKLTHHQELLSHGVLPGTIQVPPSGQPVVLLADAQTTGGYARIGQVIDCDLYHLAQLRPREPLHFIYCTLEQAKIAARAQQQVLTMIEWGVTRNQ